MADHAHKWVHHDSNSTECTICGAIRLYDGTVYDLTARETEIPAGVRELSHAAFTESITQGAEAIARAIMADRAARAPDRDALASAQPEIKGLVERPTMLPPRISDEPEWAQVCSLFRVHGLGAPPWRMRDELVGWLVWARYGTALAPSVAEPFDKAAFLMSDESLPGAPFPHKGEPVAGWFGENVDAWGAEQWFDRLARAIRTHDAAVVSGDELKAETCRMVASSSAMRLVRDFESVVRNALASPPPVAEGMVLHNMSSAPLDGTGAILVHPTWGLLLGHFEGDGEGGGEWVLASDLDGFVSSDDLAEDLVGWIPTPLDAVRTCAKIAHDAHLGYVDVRDSYHEHSDGWQRADASVKAAAAIWHSIQRLLPREANDAPNQAAGE